MNAASTHGSWRSLWLVPIALFGLASLLGSGGGGGAGGAAPDTTAPTVVTTTPSDGATDVNGDPAITVSFSEPMDPATVTTSTFSVSEAGGTIAGTVSLIGTTATFTPAGLLAAQTLYTARVTTGVKDLAGNALAADYVWTFTTEKLRKAFVTSTTGSANLGSWADATGQTGLAAADAICQARATAAGLTGTFKAWLSDENNDAYCRMHDLAGKKATNCGQVNLPAAAGPWVRTDGFPFAAPIDELTELGKVYAPLRFNEQGAAAAALSYFTATDPEGKLNISSETTHCANWTSNATNWVNMGASDGTTDLWTSYGSGLCAQPLALACLQVGTGKGPALPSLPATGKKALLTSVAGNGNLGGWSDAGGNTGIAAGDAICRARAAAAGLANAAKFKAWLSDGTLDASARLISDGPWVRLDGVPIANSKADLLDGTLFSSINLTETGVYFGNYAVWSGTADNGTRTPTHCSGWTDGTSAAQGTHGSAASAASGWSNLGTLQCHVPIAHLYCLEDD